MSFSLCSTALANTGDIKCDVSRGVLSKIFIFNDSFSSGDYASGSAFMTALVAASKKSKTASGKIFPFPVAEEINDTSESNKEGSLGLGFKAVLLEGKPAYQFKAFAGSVQLKNLRKFNNKTVGIMEYDANGNFWGTKSGTTFKGFAAKVFVTGGKIATGQNVEEGIATVTVSILDPTEYFDNAYFMPIDGNINDVAGLMDVDIYEAATAASNVYKMGARLETSQMGNYINLHDSFATEMASAGLWSAKTGTTYATTLAITSVASNAAGYWDVTFDSTAFSALGSGTKIKVSFAAPETLDAANVTGVEGVSVIVTK